MLDIMRASREGILARGESAKISFAPIHMRRNCGGIEISICHNFPRSLSSIRESRGNVCRREARNLGRNVERFGEGCYVKGSPWVGMAICAWSNHSKLPALES